MVRRRRRQPGAGGRSIAGRDLQAILAHLTSDDPDQLLAGTSAGRPGGSAHEQWQRTRAAEWAVWARTLPWRLAATLGIGAAAGVLGSLLAPRLALVLGPLAAVTAGWGLRFRPSSDAIAWRRGAPGSGAPPASWLGWSDRGGWSCTTWPSRAAGPTWTTW